jgi:hypothetical protein
MCALLRRHATGSPNPNDIHGNAATQPLRFLQCLACATLPFGGYSSRGQANPLEHLADPFLLDLGSMEIKECLNRRRLIQARRRRSQPG